MCVELFPNKVGTKLSLICYKKNRLPYLVVVLKQLNDYFYVGMIVFYRNHTKNVGGVFSIRVFAVLVCQNEAGVCFFDLTQERSDSIVNSSIH